MASEFEAPEAIRLGRLIFLPTVKKLHDDKGETVYLRPQSEKVLLVLVDNLGTLVRRDDLIEAVWPDLNVTDDSLTQCISDIRRALGDRSRKVLQTVPKRGFVLNGGEFITTDEPRIGAILAETAAGFDASSAALVHLQGGDNAAQQVLSQSAQVVDANDAQVTMLVQNLPETLRRALDETHPNIKIGIDVTGRSAATAKDMSDLAGPGEMIVSVGIKEAATSAPEFEFEDLGDVQLRRSGHSERLFRAHLFDPKTAVVPDLSAADVLPTIAVISPRLIVGDDPGGAMGDLIADELASALSRTRDARVISRMSCLPFQGPDLDLRNVWARLGADFVITGRYRLKGPQVVLDIELASRVSNETVLFERFAIDKQDVLNGFDLVQEIVSKIRKSIVLNEIKRVRLFPVESLDNYSLLCAAVGLMHRLSPSDFNWAKKLLEALVDRAPHQPNALAWLARWHVLKAQQGWSDNPKEDATTAMECASRALDLDPENTHALVNRGIVLTNLFGQLDDAEEDYNTALTHNPNDAHGRLLRGMLYAFQDRGTEGVRDTEQALALAPLDPHRFFFLALAAGANLTAGNYDRTLELTKASLRLNRTHASTLRMLVVAHHLSGDEAAAQKALKDLERMQPNLRVSDWLRSSPSAPFQVGQIFADALRAVGVPE
ncbi:MAG: winged helix-turn-helix domain-containing tetratricopeptide repeat protein [Pelagimonas sp.]|uniref:winged helix-turn-helix domain-containing tetratricopeptide repeat protein n=1 Tax=Pelagimonas sp. TaxID=2073170 RepID=UPI003D6B4FDD